MKDESLETIQLSNSGDFKIFKSYNMNINSSSTTVKSIVNNSTSNKIMNTTRFDLDELNASNRPMQIASNSILSSIFYLVFIMNSLFLNN